MNNTEKNTYVKNQIIDTSLKLLEENDWKDISISQITSSAEVSRNSFYRNFSDKEDILFQYTKNLITAWNKEYEKLGLDSNSSLYSSLFQHLYENREFYLLLKKQNLFHLVLNVLLDMAGPKPEQDNMTAYVTSFISYGTYGWIEEWIARGMQESAETMAALLSSNNIK